MKTRTLGPFTVSAIGLGAMPVSMNNDRKYPPEAEAIATVHAALDAGVTLIDTADIYSPTWDSMGHNELIVAKAIKSWGGDKSSLVVATKAGITRSDGEVWGRDGSLTYLRSAVEKSLKNLEVDVIDLYQYHRPDRSMPFGEVMANFATLRDEGKIKSIGISNANVEEIEVAIQALGEGNLVSVQNQFSPRYPSSYDELLFCQERGIGFLPWSPLGGTGGGAKTTAERFGVFGEIGTAHGVSPQQVVLAWELALGSCVIPIPGASRPASITDSAKAADLELSADEVQQCSDAVRIDLFA